MRVDYSVGTIELGALQRELKKGQSVAVQRLVDLMGSKDEKIALQAIKVYLETAVNVAKEIAADKLTRMIATARQAQASGMLSNESGPAFPQVDFDNVQDV